MVQKKKQLAHLFDATQCISCGACILACSQTNFPEMHNQSIPGRNWPASNIRIFRSDKTVFIVIVRAKGTSLNARCVFALLALNQQIDRTTFFRTENTNIG